MNNAFLAGSTFYLRGLDERDLAGPYPSWFNDPEVCRFNSHGRSPATLPQMEAYVRKVQNSATDLVLAIVLKVGERHIGNISLQKISWVDRSAEYAIVMGDKDSWGKGIAKEASLLLLQHGFRTLNLHRIYCGTSEKNLPMQKLAAAMGMKAEGRRRQALFKEGNFQDILEYGILQEEFS